MRNIITHKRGQFVIIAALIVALMMISFSPLLHEAAIYYTHEPWDEYLALIGGIELNLNRLMTLSLANYTQTISNPEVLQNNLEQWRADLAQIYPGRGVLLDYAMTGSGITCSWNHSTSISSANVYVNFTLSSIGLKGYSCNSTLLLGLTILSYMSDKVNVIVWDEKNLPVKNLNENNFLISAPNIGITDSKLQYNADNVIVYTLTCNGTIPQNAIIHVWDQRGIKVTGQYST